MSSQLQVSTVLSAEQVASAFWDLGSDGMADFFAELKRISDGKLCLQMAYTVAEMYRRADAGDRDAQNGFQTMLSHSQAFVESAIDYRAFEANRELERMAKAAKGGES